MLVYKYAACSSCSSCWEYRPKKKINSISGADLNNSLRCTVHIIYSRLYKQHVLSMLMSGAAGSVIYSY